jgi:hypothetical protein
LRDLIIYISENIKYFEVGLLMQMMFKYIPIMLEPSVDHCWFSPPNIADGRAGGGRVSGCTD